MLDIIDGQGTDEPPRLLTSNDKGELTVWDESMNSLHTLPVHPLRTWWFAIAEDNYLCATCSADGSIKCNNASSFPSTLSFFYNSYFVAMFFFFSLLVVDLEKKEVVKTLTGHDSPVWYA